MVLSGVVGDAVKGGARAPFGITTFEIVPSEPYYRRDLALIHHLGYGFHAALCAPAILELLEPVRARGGLVVELGCGSGLLTRYLTDAGHRVVATDASPAMVELAREYAPDTVGTYRLTVPDDPIPAADAIVAIGHPLNYLPDEASVERALVAIARSLLPGGVVAIDLCDLEWGEARRDAPPVARIREDWAIITEFEVPAPNRFVRRIATFVRNDDGMWRRDDERHDNVLIDRAGVPDLLAGLGVEATVSSSFGDEQLPTGLYAVVGRRLEAT